MEQNWISPFIKCVFLRKRVIGLLGFINFSALLLFNFVFINQPLYAQQLPLFSQYTFSAFLLNPAAAGAEGYTAINLTSRSQWTGVEGAPTTGIFSIQSRIMKRNYVETNASIRKRYMQPLRSGRVGIAAGIYYDHAGQIDQTNAFFTYAYHIATGGEQFSLGATFSLMQYKVNTSFLSNTDQQDLNLNGANLLVYLPDCNIGAYYTNQKMFLGFSILQLAQGSAHLQNYHKSNFIIYRHFYLIGGYKYEMNDQVVWKPSLYIKTSQQFLIQMDATIKIIYDERFWLGVAYRTGNSFISSVGIRIDRLNIGYSFDYGNNGLMNNSYGSHELMVAIKLGDNVRRYRWMDRY